MIVNTLEENRNKIPPPPPKRKFELALKNLNKLLAISQIRTFTLMMVGRRFEVKSLVVLSSPIVPALLLNSLGDPASSILSINQKKGSF